MLGQVNGYAGDPGQLLTFECAFRLYSAVAPSGQL
jgi:hypothetical protein